MPQTSRRHIEEHFDNQDLENGDKDRPIDMARRFVLAPNEPVTPSFRQA
jgi:hypothetical protein